MFLGEHQHTLDAKGRVSLPAKFRAEMSGRRLVVMKGVDRCLYVYAADEFERQMGRLMAKDDFDPRFRQARLFVASGAMETELDSAGRVSLPPTLREYARLGKDVTVVGNFERVELWDTAEFAAFNGQTTEHIGAITQELSEQGHL